MKAFGLSMILDAGFYNSLRFDKSKFSISFPIFENINSYILIIIFVNITAL
jgi:hypothetical protein